MTTPAKAPTNSWSDFVKWGGAFAVFAIVVLALSDSDDWGDVAVTGAWVTGLGAFFYWYDAADISLASLIGQSPSVTK